MRVPIFLFNGILEAGKTLFINNLLQKPAFADGKQTLVIACEEGIEEYDEAFLKKNNIALVMIDNEEDLTAAFLKEQNMIYEPARVIIEYNGMWSIDTIFDLELPTNWFLYQSLIIVNAESFNLYITNMRAILIEQFQTADMVIINRVSEGTNLSGIRGTVKAVNGEAKLFTINDKWEMEAVEEELPYDINAEIIEVPDEYYGIWYIDMWEEPKNYVGKKVMVQGLFFQEATDPKDRFTFGRFAMPCCAEDISLMGLYCHSIGKPKFQSRDSVKITAEVRWGEAPVYEGEGPILYVKKVELASAPQAELVTFN